MKTYLQVAHFHFGCNESPSHCTSITATPRQIPRTTPTLVISQPSTLAEQPWEKTQSKPLVTTQNQTITNRSKPQSKLDLDQITRNVVDIKGVLPRGI